MLRGANASTLGANTLGGAINAVTPTGRTAPGGLLRFEFGADGFARWQASYGAASGPFDAWFSYTGLTDDGYRDHASGRSTRFNANAGYRWTDQLETRVYVTYNTIFQQIPGAVSHDAALNAPRRAATANLIGDYQRNIESLRLGTRTAWRAAGGRAGRRRDQLRAAGAGSPDLPVHRPAQRKT